MSTVCKRKAHSELRTQNRVAVLLNEDAATFRIAGEAGVRCFSDAKAFKRYVTTDVLGEAVHA
jgi:hypothetical protein